MRVGLRVGRGSRMSSFDGPVGDRGNGVVVEPLHEVEVRNVRLDVGPARLHAVLRVRSPLPTNSVIQGSVATGDISLLQLV